MPKDDATNRCTVDFRIQKTQVSKTASGTVAHTPSSSSSSSFIYLHPNLLRQSCELLFLGGCVINTPIYLVHPQTLVSLGWILGERAASM